MKPKLHLHKYIASLNTILKEECDKDCLHVLLWRNRITLELVLLILLPPEFRAFFTIFLIILVLEMDAFVSFLFCLFIVRERPISFVFYQLFKNIDFVRSQNFRKFSIFFSKIVSLIKRSFGFKHNLFSQVCYEKSFV